MKNPSRRRFIKQTVIGTAGIAAMPLLQSFRPGANETIRFGIIGLGQQALNLMRGFARIPGIEIVSGADVYGIKRERFQKRMKDFYQEKGVAVEVKTYKEILDRKDIDAYVGWAPQPYNLPEEVIPADLDWNQWLGLLPSLHYNSRLNPPVSLDPVLNEKYWAEWRYFKETGGGFTCEWGAHNFDIGQWGLDMDRSGPIKIIPAAYIETDHLTYIYENGVSMSNKPWNEGKTRGIKFWGADGWIEVSRGVIKASDSSLLSDGSDDKNKGLLYESGTSHLDNFVESVRERTEPIANVETGQRICVTCLLGNIATELKRPVRWDPEKQYFVNDPEVEKYFHREYRVGYQL